MTKPRGFMDDLSSEAQSARAKKNKGRTPWRADPICPTIKAQAVTTAGKQHKERSSRRLRAHQLSVTRR